MPIPNSVFKPEDIINARAVVKDVYMDEKIERYIVDIVFASRFLLSIWKFYFLIPYFYIIC